MRRLKKVPIAEVEYTAFSLARELMTWDEPIPEFGSRFPNILESCLATPFQTFNQKPFYKGLTGKAAILFYLMIKNHPFKNGNKRIAVMTLLLFLARNSKWLTASHNNLYTMAVGVAKSNPKKKDPVIADIQKFLEANIIDFF